MFNYFDRSHLSRFSWRCLCFWQLPIDRILKRQLNLWFIEIPVKMAKGFALAIEAGVLGRAADPMEPRDMASPSTPVIGRAFT